MTLRLADIVGRPDRHCAVRRAVAPPVLAPLRARQPQLTRKYLSDFHLAIGLTTDERAALMIHHYDFLATAMSARVLGAIVARGETLWRHESEAGTHRIDLVFSHPTDNEGELSLLYSLDGMTLSICSFSFAPGSLVAAPDTTVIAVTRIQGIRSEAERLRAAMRAIAGLSPAMVFLAVLTGIADHFAITTLAGVAASAQPARGLTGDGARLAVYDAFFKSIGGVRATPIFYRVTLPRPERPLAEVKSSNRARTKAQRDLRAGIARATRAALDA